MKIYDITACETNNCNTHIVWYLKKYRLFSNPFQKNDNWLYLWINSLKFSTVCFYCMTSCGLWTYIETKLQNICFTSYKTFSKKQEEVWNESPCIIVAWCLKKNISLVIFYYLVHYLIKSHDQMSWLTLLREILTLSF